MNKITTFVFFFFVAIPTFAITEHRALHINAGQFATIDSGSFYYLSFNPGPIFSQQSARIVLEQGDSLVLDLYNHDSVDHRFYLPGFASQMVTAGSSVNIRLYFPDAGLFMFYDDLLFPKNVYLGLSGMIVVTETGRNTRNFFWDLRSHEKQWNLAAGAAINPAQYSPDYFTINGQSYPQVQNDSVVRINGHVGDTILLFLMNSGLSLHSIHFHGYHGRVLSGTAKRLRKNAVKDTFPVGSLESVVLEIVPDKPGIFPVHDHNLVAISGGGHYPNGMLVMMEVLP